MPYSALFGDQFYCKTDGRRECGHVFLSGNGLPERWQDRTHRQDSGTFTIGELGFGTGLNLCETWRQWKIARHEAAHLHFVAFELYPMQAAEIEKALTRFPEVAAEKQRLVSLWPHDPHGVVMCDLDDRTRLTVLCGDALDRLLSCRFQFDAWFLDGFAPARNPAMWSQDLMCALYEKTVDGGTFATYAAAGFVRRNLQTAGFTVEKRPGFAGKREMLCGRR